MNNKQNDLEPEVRLLSKSEVCDRVGATFPTIWQWMRDGKFPRAQFGRSACLAGERNRRLLPEPARAHIPR